jgi:hypothetical protein
MRKGQQLREWARSIQGRLEETGTYQLMKYARDIDALLKRCAQGVKCVPRPLPPVCHVNSGNSTSARTFVWEWHRTKRRCCGILLQATFGLSGPELDDIQAACAGLDEAERMGIIHKMTKMAMVRDAEDCERRVRNLTTAYRLLVERDQYLLTQLQRLGAVLQRDGYGAIWQAAKEDMRRIANWGNGNHGAAGMPASRSASDIAERSPHLAETGMESKSAGALPSPPNQNVSDDDGDDGITFESDAEWESSPPPARSARQEGALSARQCEPAADNDKENERRYADQHPKETIIHEYDDRQDTQAVDQTEPAVAETANQQDAARPGRLPTISPSPSAAGGGGGGGDSEPPPGRLPSPPRVTKKLTKAKHAEPVKPWDKSKR